jgi:hypothetical protein
MSLTFDERLDNYQEQRPYRKYVTPRQGWRLRKKAWKHGELPKVGRKEQR